jgi:ferredoxin--NADP+ reductase
VNLLGRERVLAVRHWTDRLFSFTTTRGAAFRFANGQFTMLGLESEGKILLRAYSMVSANYDGELEFLSIKVPDGPLTSRLQRLSPGDFLLVNRKPGGTLVKDNLLPGQALYLLATGTGVAPFLSIIKDPALYDSFGQIVLFHGCRRRDELVCSQEAVDALHDNVLVGDMARTQLRYYPAVTRETHANTGRITDLVASGKLFADLGMPAMDPENSRVMLCGNPRMLEEMQAFLASRGFSEGRSAKPGHYIVERAFVER